MLPSKVNNRSFRFKISLVQHEHHAQLSHALHACFEAFAVLMPSLSRVG
jgi:hypothetical protein